MTDRGEIAALIILVAVLAAMLLAPAPRGRIAPGPGSTPCGHTRSGEVIYCIPPR